MTLLKSTKNSFGDISYFIKKHKYFLICNISAVWYRFATSNEISDSSRINKAALKKTGLIYLPVVLFLPSDTQYYLCSAKWLSELSKWTKCGPLLRCYLVNICPIMGGYRMAFVWFRSLLALPLPPTASILSASIPLSLFYPTLPSQFSSAYFLLDLCISFISFSLSFSLSGSLHILYLGPLSSSLPPSMPSSLMREGGRVQLIRREH